MVATNKAVTPAKTYELVVIEADGETSVIPIGAGQSTIGSDASCQVLIADSSVAPHHAELLLDHDGSLWLRDLAGQQTTMVNGMITERAQLEDGSFIKVGLVDLSVRERGANSGAHGTVIRDSSAGMISGIGAQPSAPPPAVTPLRKSTIQRAYRTGSNPPPPNISPVGGTTPGIRPAPLSAVPQGSYLDSPEPTFTRDLPDLGEQFAPGSLIAGRYQIIAKLAEGGMGEVYKGVHVELEKMVAIKVMKRELGEDAAFADRFKREAIAASRIGQQNICEVFDFGRTPAGQFYFVMEFMDGQTLGALIRERGALPVSRAIHVFMQLCQALASAHHAGIVHRDLKPENVMILQRPGQQDFVKVLDFGVAKVHRANENNATQLGMVVGTPQYMAPEQASGLLTDARTDIYALGLIFYEMLQGKPTFSESTAALLMAAQIYRTPAPLHFVSGDPMPEHIQAFVMHMLQKAPEKRPQSMEEVINALQALQEAMNTKVKLLATPAYTPPVRPSDIAALISADAAKGQPPSGVRRPPSSGQHRPPPPQIAPAGMPSDLGEPQPADLAAAEDLAALQPKKGKGLVIGVAAGALLLLGGGAFFAFGGKEPPPQPVAEVPVARPPQPPEPAKVEPKPEPKEDKPAAAQTVSLELKSDPAGAEIKRDGFTIGTTPMIFPWELNKAVTFEFALAGYARAEKKIQPAGNMTLEVKLAKQGGGAAAAPKPKKKTGPDLADDPYGGQVEELKDAPF